MNDEPESCPVCGSHRYRTEYVDIADYGDPPKLIPSVRVCLDCDRSVGIPEREAGRG